MSKWVGFPNQRKIQDEYYLLNLEEESVDQPKNVIEAIFKCNVCNKDPYASNACKCDMRAEKDGNKTVLPEMKFLDEDDEEIIAILANSQLMQSFKEKKPKKNENNEKIDAKGSNKK